MKKFALLLSTISTLAVALPGLEIPSIEHKSPPTTCTDFSGDWKGQCSDGTTVTPTEVKIVQRKCTDISLDGRGSVLNGMVTANFAPKEGSPTTVVTTMEWVKNNTEIHYEHAVLRPKVGGSTFYGAFKLDSGRLIYSSWEQNGTYVSNCKLWK